jgi:PAS domain S-box-containing protein
MPRLSIAQRLALLAASVAVLMTIAICLLSYSRGRAVLTAHELVDLGDEANLRMFEVREEFRFLMREVREATAELPRVPTDRPTTAHFHSPEFSAALPEVVGRLLEHAADRSHQSQWNWISRRVYLEVYCLTEDADGSTQRVRALRREDAKMVEVDAGEAPLAAEALADLQARVRRTTEKHKPVTARQFLSDLKPVRGEPTRRALCIGFEFVGSRGLPAGLLVVAVDFTRMIENEQRHSPRHLFLVTDETGRFLVNPDPAAVGTTVREDRDSRGRTRFDFQTVPWAEVDKSGGAPASLGESLHTGEFGPSLSYFFLRRPYDKGLPFRSAEQRDELDHDLDAFAKSHPAFRFTRPRAQSRDIAFAGKDKEVLKDAQKIVEKHEKAADVKLPSDWEGPIECTTFAAHVVPLRLGTDPTAADEGGGGLVYLIVAASLQEIGHDIWLATRWVLWISLMLCVLTGCLALLPAHLLTRPLLRINRAAERLAKGDYGAELPIASTSEIGTLARTFRHMATEIKLRDEALHDALARMQAVLRTAADGIITFNERGIIEEWNQASERIFGYTAEEMKGERIQKLMEIPAELARTEDSTDRTVRSLKRVLSTPALVRQGRRKDGSTFWLEAAFSEVPVGDRRLTTGIFRDVTRRVEDEERIKQMNELLEARVRLRTAELQDAKAKLEAALQVAQAASKAKDVFVRTISHELRTPLSAVKGFTELLLNPKATKLRENPVPTLQKIRSASEYLLTLINDLLDVARFTAGEQIHLNISEFELGSFFQGIVEMTNPLLRKNNDQFVAEAAGELGRMRADETRVRQIMLNLLSNAAKFTENGTVTFRAARETRADGEWVVFSVSDTGPGMTPEQLQNLFKPFYRADTSTTRRHGGTGLGLSISKLLCERMGGSIAVESESGKGSTFTVRLPAVVPEPDDGVAPSAIRPAAPGLPPLKYNTILIVDDDQMSREMIQSFLQREGFHVLLAATGEEGIRIAREERPGAITLDVMMPDMDGWAVLAALKSDPLTHDIPVIMLTVAEDRSRGYTLGASDYVTKPVDWNRLSEILKKYFAEPASILVVEDDAGQRDHITQALTLAGWKVREAADGREALQQVDAQRPAIILLDLLMPNMDGFEFLDELRRREGGQNIPVIVVTAKDLDDTDRTRLQGSVANVLHKGAMSREELLARIRTEVRGRVPEK